MAIPATGPAEKLHQTLESKLCAVCLRREEGRFLFSLTLCGQNAIFPLVVAWKEELDRHASLQKGMPGAKSCFFPLSDGIGTRRINSLWKEARESHRLPVLSLVLSCQKLTKMRFRFLQEITYSGVQYFVCLPWEGCHYRIWIKNYLYTSTRLIIIYFLNLCLHRLALQKIISQKLLSSIFLICLILFSLWNYLIIKFLFNLKIYLLTKSTLV